MLKYIIVLTCLPLFAAATNHSADSLRFFSADNHYIQYTGRIDFSNRLLPRFWSPGVYITAKFTGTACNIILNEEELYGKQHNYLEIVIDDRDPYRIQTNGRHNIIEAAKNLPEGAHTITICKNTESNIGYLEFEGIRCRSLLPLPPTPSRKIECIGNSITCGTGMDISVVPCGKGEWYDQHNAYMSYGAVTARSLRAQWQLTCVSGIGLVHSCCNMDIVMPQVFDKVQLRTDSIPWDFSRYQPDVLTVCLGQNDGIQDSAFFCSSYIKFIRQLREKYPRTEIICLTSPMADATLAAALKKYLLAVETFMQKGGDKKVHHYFFSKQYHNGCGGHPDLAEHQLIAKELAGYIRQLMKWR